ncbi:hypothetical protein EV645_2525 [Kribbella rubisoli]|uniref:Uncharacterized protein n=1 Tax=Kribbella rubisoli TaxID=3075929 RepID=A0A4Q7XB02_9ACTN|nr:hypothetical protein [Kribbella rubisoli]RZU20294.1 hypothetical protein EV645_2525 [Kribbella rubisoli]
MSARLFAAVVAALAFLPALPAQADTPELPDRIAAAWRTDHVSVDERLRATMPASELARIRTAIRTAGLPVYVALVPQSPYLRASGYDLPTLLHARIGEPGVYIVAVVYDNYWSDQAELFRPAGLRGRDLSSVRADDKQDSEVVDERPAPQIVRTIQQASTAYDGRPLPQVPAADLEPQRSEGGLSVTDKEDRSAYVGLGVGAVLGFALVLFLGLRRRRPAKRVRREHGGDSPPTEAWDVELKADDKIKQAERALARLDKRNNKSTKQLDQRDDAYRRLDAARTLRADQPEDLLAAAGALVLARQAERVASGAELQPPCFFNPTHNPGTSTVDWEDEVEVPACQSCVSVIRRGRTPIGLRVWSKSGLLGHDRKQVPYWTLDPEDNPMVATGFGGLSDDLPERIAVR